MKWLRKLIGIDEIVDDIRATRIAADKTAEDMAHFRAELTSLLVDEFHPMRKKASDALGKRVMDRLIAEDKARKLSEGKL